MSHRTALESKMFSNPNINDFGIELGRNLQDGFEIQDSGLAFQGQAPVWYAVMVKYL